MLLSGDRPLSLSSGGLQPHGESEAAFTPERKLSGGVEANLVKGKWDGEPGTTGSCNSGESCPAIQDGISSKKFTEARAVAASPVDSEVLTDDNTHTHTPKPSE